MSRGREPRLRVKAAPGDGHGPYLGRDVCGTNGGAKAHTYYGEPKCDACKKAEADYLAAYRFRTGHVRSPRRCGDCGSVFAEHSCGAPERVSA